MYYRSDSRELVIFNGYGWEVVLGFWVSLFLVIGLLGNLFEILNLS